MRRDIDNGNGVVNVAKSAHRPRQIPVADLLAREGILLHTAAAVPGPTGNRLRQMVLGVLVTAATFAAAYDYWYLTGKQTEPLPRQVNRPPAAAAPQYSTTAPTTTVSITPVAVATPEIPAPPPAAAPPPAPAQPALPLTQTRVVQLTQPQLRTYMQPAMPWIAPWTGFIPHW